MRLLTVPCLDRQTSFMCLVIYESALNLKLIKVHAECYLLFKTSLL